MNQEVIIKYASQYYVKVDAEDNNHFLIVYDPHRATKFPSKEEAEKWLYENTEYEGTPDDWTSFEIVDATDTLKKFDEWWQNGTVIRKEPKLDRRYSRPYNGESCDEILEWYINSRGKVIKYSHYETYPRIRDVFQHLFDVIVYTEGRRPEGKEYLTFQVRVHPKDTFETFQEELNLASRYVTRKYEDGSLMYDVLDHELNAYHHVCILQHEDGTYSVGDFRFEFAPRMFLERVSLQELFEYLRRKRYLELAT